MQVTLHLLLLVRSVKHHSHKRTMAAPWLCNAPMATNEVFTFHRMPVEKFDMVPCRSDTVMEFNGHALNGCSWNLSSLADFATPPYLLKYVGPVPVQVSVRDPPHGMSIFQGTDITKAVIELEYLHLPEIDIGSSPFTVVPSNESSVVCNLPAPPFKYRYLAHSTASFTDFNETHVGRAFPVPEIPCAIPASTFMTVFISKQQISLDTVQHLTEAIKAAETPTTSAGDLHPMVWVGVSIIILIVIIAAIFGGMSCYQDVYPRPPPSTSSYSRYPD